MDTSALSSSSLATPPIAHPPNDNTSSADTAAATPIQPASVKSDTPFHTFFEHEDVKSLSDTERGRFTKALKTGITWIKQAIAALSKPFSKETQKLVDELIPGGLENPSDRKMLESELTRTMDGMQKMLDRQASNVGSSANMPIYDALTNKNTGEMHFSSKFLADGSDDDLAALTIHEASHAYAGTKDNWQVTPHGPPTWLEFLKSMVFGNPPKFDRRELPSKEAAPYTSSNAIGNAYTVQYTTEVLAGRPYESLT